MLIDKCVLRDCKKRLTNLSMAWIDYRKAFDMVPHSWILECLGFFGCALNVCKFIEMSMSKWRSELVAGGKVLGGVEIRRGLFQGDSLSPLLFVLCVVPLTLVLREVKAGYKMKEMNGKINHLLYIDDLKLYGKNNDQIDSLVRTVNLVSKDIGMEFGIKKCGILSLKRGKVTEHEGIILPSGDKMKSIEDEGGYKYLGILEMDVFLEKEMKEKVMKEYKRRLRLVLKSKLNGKNKIQGINTWAVALVRYSGGILDWKNDELKKIDRQTRKMMTMYGALHPKSDVDRLYLPRKIGGRGLISCEKCIRAEENNIGWYIKNVVEPLLMAVRQGEIVVSEHSMRKDQYKKMEMTETEDRNDMEMDEEK